MAWLEERSYPIKDPLTGQTRMVSLVMDVTERKTAEIALKQSEDRARFMVRLDDALRTIIDPDEVSHTAARLLAEHLRCNRALYAEMDPDQDHCTVVGEYTSGPPKRCRDLSAFRLRRRLRRVGSRESSLHRAQHSA